MDDKELLENLQRLETILPSEIPKILWKGADGIIRSEIVDNLNNRVLKVRTGRLKNSVITVPTKSEIGGRYAVEIKTGGFWGQGSELKYARIHEYGGIIRPRKRQYLSFKVDGRWVKTKMVIMPKRAYVEPAIEKTKPFLIDYIKKEFGRLL